MASKIARADGLFTAAATWGVVDTTSILNTGLSSGSSTNVATAASWGSSATFAPGAIEIDGFAVAIYSRNAAPSGTLSVRLYNVTDAAAVATITINVSDILEASTTNYQQQRWYFFYIGATTLIAAKNYRIEAQTSAASQVSLYTNGTASNWLRMLRTTTTGAPANPDLLFVMGEWTAAATKTNRTVTMDNTANTIFGGAVVNQDALFIGNGGTVAVGGPAAGNPPAAATAYYLKLGGDLYIAAGGAFSGGTVGAEVPRDSSFVLEFDSASAKLYNVRNRGSFILQGLSRTTAKNVVQCKLNGDEAVGQTILSVDADTGWLNADEVCIAGTAKAANQDELRTVNASDATTITVTAGLTNAHKGSQGQEAEVILLTRNVIVRGVSASYHSGIYTNGVNATWDCDWVMFKWIGGAARTGIQHNNQAKVDTYTFCSWYDCYASPNIETGTGGYGLTLTDCVLKFLNTIAIAGGGCYGLPNTPNAAFALTWTRVTCLGFNTAQTFATLFSNFTTVWTNVTVTGINTTALTLSNSTAPSDEFSKLTLTDVTLHSGANTNALTIGNIAHQTFTRLTIWGWNGSLPAMYFTGTSRKLTFDTCKWWGNAVAGIGIALSAAPILLDHLFKDCILAGQTNLSQPDGIYVTNGNWSPYARLRFENCAFGVATGNYVAHTTADVEISASTAYYSPVLDFTFIDCNLGSGAGKTIKNLDYLLAGFGTMRQSKIAGAANTHQTSISKTGTLAYDAANFRTAAPGETLTPACVAGSSTKFRSTIKRAAVASGATLTVTVYFKKSVAYAGTNPKLLVLANPALGWDADVTLDQDAGSTAAWTALTGTTAAAGEDGLVELCVEIDGAAGAVYVDDWTAV